MRRIGRLLRAFLVLLLPTALIRPLLRWMGYNLASGTRIGFSFVNVDAIHMASGARIGHFNFISGPFTIRLGVNAAIGHINLISRGRTEAGAAPAVLSLGEWSKITGIHRVDLTNSVIMGSFSTIAGHGCQLWTHGYIHEMEGIARYRIDGPIEIGDNVYVGAATVISMGVTLGSGVIVGAGSAVSKSLPEPGLYVSSPMRQLPRPADPASRADLEHVPDHSSGDIVYRKVR